MSDNFNQNNISAHQDNEILNALRQVLVISEGKENEYYDAVYQEICAKFRGVYSSEKIAFIFHNINMRMNFMKVINNDSQKNLRTSFVSPIQLFNNLVVKTHYLLTEYENVQRKIDFVNKILDDLQNGDCEALNEILGSIKVCFGPMKTKNQTVDMVYRPKYSRNQIQSRIMYLRRMVSSDCREKAFKKLLEYLQEYNLDSISIDTDNLKDKIKKVYMKEYDGKG